MIGRFGGYLSPKMSCNIPGIQPQTPLEKGVFKNLQFLNSYWSYGNMSLQDPVLSPANLNRVGMYVESQVNKFSRHDYRYAITTRFMRLPCVIR
jgi:hypothetical protein